MASDFHQIQATERRRSWFLVVLLSLMYLAMFTSMILGYRLTVRALSPKSVMLNPIYQEELEEVAREPLMSLQLLLGVWAFGGFLVAIQAWFARNHAVESILKALDAHDPDESDRYHVRFRNTVQEMAIAAGRGGQVRPVVVPSAAMTAFATDDARSGAVVGVTEGLLSRLSRAQMQAAVAHEMAHINEGDVRLTSVI